MSLGALQRNTTNSIYINPRLGCCLSCVCAISCFWDPCERFLSWTHTVLCDASLSVHLVALWHPEDNFPDTFFSVLQMFLIQKYDGVRSRVYFVISRLPYFQKWPSSLHRFIITTLFFVSPVSFSLAFCLCPRRERAGVPSVLLIFAYLAPGPRPPPSWRLRQGYSPTCLLDVMACCEL